MYEFKLMEWRDACRVLQENITQAKYENQIELARKREELEADYEAQLNKLTANARQDAHLSKFQPLIIKHITLTSLHFINRHPKY